MLKILPKSLLLLFFIAVTLASAVDLPNYSKEVVAFTDRVESEIWEKYEWSKLTTLILHEEIAIDERLIQYAHRQSVRVQLMVPFSKLHLNDANYQRLWIKKKVQLVQENNLDGLNFHFTDEIENNESDAKQKLNQVIINTAKALKQAVPKARISFNAPWAAINANGTAVDNRNYDYKTIFDHVDHFIITSFYLASQQFIGNEYQDDECFAHPNSGVINSLAGLFSWTQLVKEKHRINVASSQSNKTQVTPLHKIIYLHPLFGMDYACPIPAQYNRCILPPLNWRGVNCTDRVAKFTTYKEAFYMLNNNVNGSNWQYDPHSETGFIEYTDAKNVTHQLWCEEPESLKLKMKFVDEFQIGGTGFFQLNYLDYDDSDQLARETREQILATLPDYKTNQIFG